MTPQNKSEGVRVEGTEEEEIGDMIEVEKRVEMAPQKKKSGRTTVSKIPKENPKSAIDLSKTENKSEEVGEIMKCVLRVVEELKESNRELKAENEALRKDIGEMRAELKVENEALRKEIGEMRVELKALAKPGLSQAWQAAPSSLRTLFLGT
jgi:FtsZ-binding cell division protein ZapB